MLNHTLQPLEVSAWPDDLRQALERGLFCPLNLDDPDDIPNVGDIKKKVRPLHPEAQRGTEPVEPGGVAGRDARSGDTGPPQECHWPRGGPANATAGPGLGGG